MPSESGDRRGRLDVVVIGAGPAGEAAAQLAGTLGYSVALVERDMVWRHGDHQRGCADQDVP